MPKAIAFAESITLPPPTARTKSIFSRRQSAMPSRTSPLRGLGCTPPSGTYATPAASSEATTLSYTPFAFTLPPPKCSSAFVPPYLRTSAPVFSSAPRPNTNRVGE